LVIKNKRKEEFKMKNVKLVGLALVGVLLLGACEEPVDKAEKVSNGGEVVKDGGEIVYEDGKTKVTELQLLESLKNLVGEDVVKQAIGQEILLANYEVSDKQLKERVSILEKEYESSGGLDSQLELMGMSKEIFNKQVKVEIANELALRDKNKVTEDEIKKRFEEVKKAANVQFFVSPDNEQIKVIEKAMKDGKSFKDIQNLVASQGANGSVIEETQFVKGQIPVELDSVFDMKDGEVKSFETPAGTQLVKYVGSEELKFEDLKKQVEEELLYSGVSSFDDLLIFLVEKYKVELKGDYKDILKSKDEATSTDTK
jgi:hypothetical protein